MADGFISGLAEELAKVVREVVREELAAAGVGRTVEKDWLTLEEAAQMLGYSPAYMRRRKDIPRHSTGERGAGRLRYRRVELDEWLAKRGARS